MGFMGVMGIMGDCGSSVVLLAVAYPVVVEELSGRLIHALVGVGAKVIALRLEQVRGQTLGTIAVEIAKRCAYGRDGNPGERGLRDNGPPVVLGALDDFLEVRIEKKV